MCLLSHKFFFFLSAILFLKSSKSSGITKYYPIFLNYFISSCGSFSIIFFLIFSRAFRVINFFHEFLTIISCSIVLISPFSFVLSIQALNPLFKLFFVSSQYFLLQYTALVLTYTKSITSFKLHFVITNTAHIGGIFFHPLFIYYIIFFDFCQIFVFKFK